MYCWGGVYTMLLNFLWKNFRFPQNLEIENGLFKNLNLYKNIMLFLIQIMLKTAPFEMA